MIEISYSKTDKFEELEISGSRTDLNDLSQSILNMLDSKTNILSVLVNTKFDPTPYDRLVGKLILSQESSAVKVFLLDENTLKISGSNLNLHIFASNLNFVAMDGNHIHYEYYEGNDYINSDAIPLVISMK